MGQLQNDDFALVGPLIVKVVCHKHMIARVLEHPEVGAILHWKSQASRVSFDRVRRLHPGEEMDAESDEGLRRIERYLLGVRRYLHEMELPEQGFAFGPILFEPPVGSCDLGLLAFLWCPTCGTQPVPLLDIWNEVSVARETGERTTLFLTQIGGFPHSA
jgi:hypothetical protein